MLTECPFYLEERGHFLCQQEHICFANVKTNTDAFVLISSEDEHILFHFGKFIYKCLRKQVN